MNGASLVRLLCSDCSRETMAIVHEGGTLEIRDRRHGHRHTLVMSPREVLVAVTGTSSDEGIKQAVNRLL